jgi:hypothetical protein
MSELGDSTEQPPLCELISVEDGPYVAQLGAYAAQLEGFISRLTDLIDENPVFVEAPLQVEHGRSSITFHNVPQDVIVCAGNLKLCTALRMRQLDIWPI